MVSRLALTGGTVVSDGIARPATVFIDDGKITAVEAGENQDRSRWGERTEISADGCYVVPGYIDLLAHGAIGFDFYSGSISDITQYFAEHGTTGVLAGLRSASLEDVHAGVARIADEIEKRTHRGCQILGSHLESVYYNPEWCGAQSADQMRRPEVEEVLSILSSSRDTLKMVSIAPELPGAIDAIKELTARGVRVSIGHTDATPEQMDAAIGAGASMVTHLFNATGGPFYKEAGVRALDVSTFALVRDALTVQVIADGIHVDPDLFRLTYRAKGAGGIALTTDASSMAGLPDGNYTGTFGREFVLKDGACRLSDGRLAASRLTLDQAVQKVVSWGIPLTDAVHMAAYVPARSIGLGDRKGRIVAGYDADIVVLSKDLDVQRTIVAGETVYSK